MARTHAPTAAAAVLALQRQAGNRATVARVRMLQRQVSSDELISRLERSIPILSLSLKKLLPQGVDVGAHLRASLALYDEHMERRAGHVDDAMRIAAILSAVAGSIARTANDPRMKPKIAAAMADVFEPQIKAALAGSGDATHISKHFKLGRDLAGNDAVIGYLTGKKPLMSAALSIVDLARRRGRDPARVFDLLQRQLEIDLAAFSLEQVESGRLRNDALGGGTFELANLTGETSPEFFSGLFEGGRPTFQNGRAKFTDATHAKLRALAAAVASPDETQNVSAGAIREQKVKRGATLSDPQAEHFERLERLETGEAAAFEDTGKSARQYLLQKFMGRYQIGNPRVAASLVTAVIEELKRAPLTITFSPDSLFATPQGGGDRPRFGPAYKSEPALIQKDYDLNQLLMLDAGDLRGAGQTVRGATLPLDPDTKTVRPTDVSATRGRNYIRWRVEKDERETRLHELAAEDLPVFGAVNPTWDKARGGAIGAASAPSASGGQYSHVPWGSNYYGSNHMVLKEQCRPRAAFIIRMKGTDTVERTSMELVLADLVRLQKFTYVDSIVYDLMGIDKLVLHGLDFEVHVYGGVDMQTDVKEFHLQHDLFVEAENADTPAGRIKRFAKAHGVAVRDIGSAPPGLKAYTMWTAPDDVASPAPAAVAH